MRSDQKVFVSSVAIHFIGYFVTVIQILLLLYSVKCLPRRKFVVSPGIGIELVK